MTAMKKDAGKRGTRLNIPIHPLFLATHPMGPRQPTSCVNAGWCLGLAITKKGSVSQQLNWPASHVPSRLRKRDPLLAPFEFHGLVSKGGGDYIFASPQDLSLVLFGVVLSSRQYPVHPGLGISH